jgi:Astacin (Peptidase family M12A)
MPEVIVCQPRRLPRRLLQPAAARATEINPLNHPPIERLTRIMPDFRPSRERIAVVTTKYWGTSGVRLTVGFLDSPPMDLRRRILSHMNAWARSANVKFTASRTDPQVRIDRRPDDGYWSYLGTDVSLIPEDEPTMNLDSFTMQTPDSEFHRVVRHETGHTMGFPHEHMRRSLVAKLHLKKTIDYFKRTQGWSALEVRQQVLTPLEESSLLGTEPPDPRSIMCYQIPGSITKDGKPIIGGRDIDDQDYAFAAKIYPKPRAAATRRRTRKARRQ